MEYLSFQVAGDAYAVSLLRAREVSVCGPVTRVPGAPPAIRGAMGLRGAVIPVVDTAVRLGGRPTSVSRRTALVFANALVEGAPVVVGLMVDALEGLLGLDPDDVLAPPPGLLLRGKGVIAGFGRVGDRLVPLLDVDALVALDGLWSLAPPEERAAGRRRRVEDRRTSSPEASGAAREAGPVLAAPPCPAAPPEAVARRRIPSTTPSSATRPLSRPGGPVPSRPAPRPRPSGPYAANVPLPQIVGRAARSAAPDALLAPPHTPPRAAASPAGTRRAAWVGGLAAGAVALALLLGEAASLRGGRGDARSSTSQGRGQLAPAAAAPTEPGRNDAPPSPPTSHALPAGRAMPGPVAISRPPEAVHEVRAGDTLWGLSRRYYGDPFLWPEIFESNRPSIGNPDLITPGERLRIPARP